MAAVPPREMVLVGFPGAQVLDVTGPLEVFASASLLARAEDGAPPSYRVRLAARARRPLATSSGLRLLPDATLGEVRGRLDTLIVVGGAGTPDAMQDPLLLAWLRAASRRTRRLASVCSGAFVLAAAGLLDGRRAATHWAWCDALARLYPSVTVDPDPIFVRDGDVWTSAGVTAGMDLALALVEEDLGAAVATRVARQLVLFLRRPGSQSQFSAQLAAQAADRQPLRELQGWIADHLTADLAVPALARRVAMSPRNFARVFARELGITPARFVERVRVEAARRRLEESADGVEAVAAGCGFGSVLGMRRAFRRTLRVAPAAYRARFGGRRYA
jgi:transcriptional regulator GlxA family with amidase domain